MAIGHRDRTAMMVVGKRFARFQMRMLGGKSSRVLLVIVAIVHIGFWHTMTITRGIQHWPRRVESLGRQEHGARDIIENRNLASDGLPLFFQWAPANDRGMGVVAFERLQPLRDIGGTRLLMIFY